MSICLSPFGINQDGLYLLSECLSGSLEARRTRVIHYRPPQPEGGIKREPGTLTERIDATCSYFSQLPIAAI